MYENTARNNTPNRNNLLHVTLLHPSSTVYNSLRLLHSGPDTRLP
jgi:hypothetical protein